MTDTTRKIPFFDFTPSKGVIRIGRTYAFICVFSTVGKVCKILPSYLMVGFGGIGHINLSNVTGQCVTIRIPGATDGNSKWLKIGTDGKTRKIRCWTQQLPKWS